MNKYQNGQIYKIVDVGFNKCYIGSTCEGISKRFSRHKEFYKSYKNNKYHFMTSFSLFDEFGVDNCKIYWIEDYPCNSKKELEKREGEIIKDTKCINKHIPCRTIQEYNEDNKEWLKSLKKKNYEDRRDEILQRIKEHRQNNLESEREKGRLSYQRNKEIQNRPYNCVCGSVCCFSARLRHFKSQKHQQYMQSLNQNNLQEPAIDQS